MGWYPLLGMLHVLALLPLGVLYVFSDCIAALIYHVVRYRRRIVRDNLTACFPNMSPKDLRRTMHGVYRNFGDYIVETIKLMHISDREMERRMTFGGVDIIDRQLDEGRTVICYFSHTGNWEWAPSVTLHFSHRDDPNDLFGQIYRPLRNARMDALMLKLRSRFGTTSIPKKTALRFFIEARREGKAAVVGFMSDQKPSHGDPVRIVSLFGRPTAVITGTETLARRLDTAVVYWDMSKPSRGHYHIDIVPMADIAEQTRPGELTGRYFELLEQTIRRQPDIWLWTHKRWKTSPRTWDDVDPKTIIHLDK